jgi:SAM-dependent methyltransferase
MAEYVNGMVSGKPMNQGGHWANYALNEHIIPHFKQRDPKGGASGLSMLTLACGSAHIEHSLLAQFQWPISRLVGLEYDSELRAAAKATLNTVSSCESEFRFFDFNAENTATEKYDIIFCCHSIHHAEDLENLLPFINECLKDDGLFIGIDYFGPTRFQIEYDVQPVIDELFSILPEELRVNLGSNSPKVQQVYETVRIKDVRDIDPSESVRSSDLRTLLFSNFEIVEIKPMGGTLLRWLFENRAGNFEPTNESHVAIARLLQFIEREFIALRRIRSDDLFFVLKKSDRLS